jgi:hypothetical protein
VQPAAEQVQREAPVGLEMPLVVHDDDQAGGPVGRSNGGAGLVPVLPAGSPVRQATMWTSRHPTRTRPS